VTTCGSSGRPNLLVPGAPGRRPSSRLEAELPDVLLLAHLAARAPRAGRRPGGARQVGPRRCVAAHVFDKVMRRARWPKTLRFGSAGHDGLTVNLAGAAGGSADRRPRRAGLHRQAAAQRDRRGPRRGTRWDQYSSIDSERDELRAAILRHGPGVAAAPAHPRGGGRTWRGWRSSPASVRRSSRCARRRLEAAARRARRRAARAARRRPETRRPTATRCAVTYRARLREPLDPNLAVFAAYWYRGYACKPARDPRAGAGTGARPCARRLGRQRRRRGHDPGRASNTSWQARRPYFDVIAARRRTSSTTSTSPITSSSARARST